MFKKILIANRGEIACRIIKTAKNMGIHTVAVYSFADKNSTHVRQADSAYWIGEAPARLSYLNSAAIIQAALEAGVEAIHPGYGFLSENPEFAEACAKADLVFIGPSIKAMKAMASKQLAKQLLEKTAVPLTPGYHGSDQSDDRLLQEAHKIGFPVLLKAASGGGGKGMRSVLKEKDFLAELSGARREAKASFGDETMIIEKLIAKPRHVEIQIMADNHGQIVHLFERDCSVQRRHQKIIEEAPAPHLSPKLRQALATAACEAARSIDYRGAGTVEFLVSADEQFYFMEMNTRLQVEHPVTEMITGLDLVEWQLRIAADEPLPCLQKAITTKGHAIECRIYAEDPQQNFMPSTGKIHYLKEPQGEGLRLDSGVKKDSDISIYYDPMIAKLIAWGNSREEALQRLQKALKNYHIGGVKTNIPFLKAVLNNKNFQNAQFTTEFLQKERLELPVFDTFLALKLCAAYDFLKIYRSLTDPLEKDCFAWDMYLPKLWFFRYGIAETEYEVQIQALSPLRFQLFFQQQSIFCTVQLEEDLLILDDGLEIHQCLVEERGESLSLYHQQGTLSVKRINLNDFTTQASQQKGQLTAPMPATIVAILKKIGEAVKAGDRLMVLEAMKMEHTIHAPTDGVLTKLFYTVGAQVNEGAELLALENMPEQE